MRTEKAILRKVREWANNPLIVIGIYRLFTYLKWEAIPEQYKSHFSAEAQATWNDDLETFKEHDIRLDIGAEITAVFQSLFKHNTTQALSVIPIILADIYMLGKPTAKAQKMVINITNKFTKNFQVDPDLAQAYAVFEIVELLEYLIKLADITLPYSPQELLSKVLEKSTAKAKSKNGLPKDIDKQIDAALDAYYKAQAEKGEQDNGSKTNV